MILAYIIVFSLLGSVCAVGLASVVLLLRNKLSSVLSAVLIPYAIGTLLGAAFLGMIPEVLKRLPPRGALGSVLAGIVAFFVLEKLALWRHCHEHPCEVHSQAGALILVGDSFHNFVDGVAIAVAFAGSIPLGIATAVAVFAHEVPQETGDFAILLQSGYSSSRALLLNGLVSLATLPGAVLTYFLLPLISSIVPYLLALSAASFIYIALADIVPGRRSTGGLKTLILELALIAGGIATIYALRPG